MYAKNCATDEDNTKNSEETLQTNKLSCGSIHSAHESSVDVLVGFYMLQVCGHIKHVVVFVALHSCQHTICCQLFSHTHFSPVCEILADFVDSHTAKTGLLRCCLCPWSRMVNNAHPTKVGRPVRVNKTQSAT